MAESDRVLTWLRSLIAPWPRARQTRDLRAGASKSPDARVRGGERPAQDRASDTEARLKAPIYVAAKRRDGHGDRR